MIALSDLRSARPAAMRAAAQGLRADRSTLLRAAGMALGARAAGAGAWSGGAASAALVRLADLSRQLGQAAQGLERTASAIVSAAGEVESALELIRRADRAAVRAGGWVDLDGRLVLPQRVVAADPGAAALQQRTDEAARVEVGSLIERGLAMATGADATLLTALRSGPSIARGTLSGPGWTAASSGAIPAPPPISIGPRDPMDAYHSSAWWTSLRPEQRRWVLREHPEWVGNRDGIPAAARHEANLTLLARAEAQARARSAEVPSWDATGRTIAAQRLESLAQARTVLQRRDGHPRRLLLLDTSTEPISVAISVGDPDAASHVATFVGGLTTHPARDLQMYDQYFTALRSAASAHGEDLATVIWMGYPAPQWRDSLSPDRTVARDHVARAYAPALASFSHGMAAARERPTHQTVLAHSYGSNLAGHALRLPHAFDDVVILGSPGMPLASRDQAALKPGSLNVMSNPGDIVSGPLGSGLGIRAVDIVGARRLATGPALAKPGVTPNGCAPGASGGHSDYFDPAKVSGRNLLGVMIGRLDLVAEPARGAGDIVRDHAFPLLGSQLPAGSCTRP